ncbi:MAG: SDR family oxidoreductase [Nitrospirae bacterium]|nr:SDR family oxidoreductase [Nitrospirota bacterium]
MALNQGGHNEIEGQGELPDLIVATQCFKRRQQPSDLLGAIVFFASEESDFITGQTLVVNGGSIMH